MHGKTCTAKHAQYGYLITLFPGTNVIWPKPLQSPRSPPVLPSASKSFPFLRCPYNANLALTTPHLDRPFCFSLPFSRTHSHSLAMRPQLHEMWILFYFFLASLEIWLDKMMEHYRKPTPLNTLVDWLSVKPHSFSSNKLPA